MRRRLGVLALALGLAGVATQPITAQPRRGSPEAAGFTQLFISPCGEPYRGRPGDPYPVALWFKTADLNHDGVIDRSEFRADHEGFFQALDNDDAGYLDGGKISFYEQQVVPDLFAVDKLGLLAPTPWRGGAQLILAQAQGPGNLQGPAEGTHPNDSGNGLSRGPPASLGATRRERPVLMGAAAYGLLAEPEPVTAADTNLDGRVTKAEFMAAADRRFALLDKRHDGKLTLDELPMTAWQVAHEGRGAGKKG
jgi:hypothetical protein